MDNGYTRYGCPTGWGAQTHPMGYRGDWARQKVRESLACLGNAVTPASWTFDATPNSRLQAHARSRS